MKEIDFRIADTLYMATIEIDGMCDTTNSSSFEVVELWAYVNVVGHNNKTFVDVLSMAHDLGFIDQIENAINEQL